MQIEEIVAGIREERDNTQKRLREVLRERDKLRQKLDYTKSAKQRESARNPEFAKMTTPESTTPPASGESAEASLSKIATAIGKVDLTKLLSPTEDSLVFDAKLGLNGRTVAVSCLANTSADMYILVNVNLVVLLFDSLGLRTRKLPHECPLTSFDGALRDPITYIVKLTLIIDGRV